MSVLDKHLDEVTVLSDNNFKDILLRYTQHMKFDPPVYVVIKRRGKPHNRTFDVECRVLGKVHGTGKGRTKKSAEQVASKHAIESIGI